MGRKRVELFNSWRTIGARHLKPGRPFFRWPEVKPKGTRENQVVSILKQTRIRKQFVWLYKRLLPLHPYAGFQGKILTETKLFIQIAGKEIAIRIGSKCIHSAY